LRAPSFTGGPGRSPEDRALGAGNLPRGARGRPCKQLLHPPGGPPSGALLALSHLPTDPVLDAAPPRSSRGPGFFFRKIHLYGKTKKWTHDHTSSPTIATFFPRRPPPSPPGPCGSNGAVRFPVAAPVVELRAFELACRLGPHRPTLYLPCTYPAAHCLPCTYPAPAGASRGTERRPVARLSGRHRRWCGSIVHPAPRQPRI
jgi:hypothetical protein